MHWHQALQRGQRTLLLLPAGQSKLSAQDLHLQDIRHLRIHGARRRALLRIGLMINSRKKLLLVVLIVGASAASGLFVWHKLTKPSEENDPVAYYLHVAHPKYNMLPRSVVSTELTGSGESYYMNFLDLLSRGTVIGASHKPSEESWIIELPGPIQQRHGLGKLKVNDAMHQKLLQQSAETLGARFAASSADEYLTVRARYGARADRALFEKRFPSSFDGTFQYLAGKPPRPDEGPSDLIRMLFDRDRPHAIGNGREAVAIAYGYAIPGEIRCDLSPTSLGYAGWYGGTTTSLEPFTTHEHDYRALITSHGPLPAAEVGFILFYKDKPPRPLCFQFVWNPIRNEWILAFTLLNNYPPQELEKGEIPIF